jgi:hypothetical protein
VHPADLEVSVPVSDPPEDLIGSRSGTREEGLSARAHDSSGVMAHNGQTIRRASNGVTESYHPTCWITLAVTQSGQLAGLGTATAKEKGFADVILEWSTQQS